MRRLGLVSVFTLLFMFLVVPPANAYLDPGSGGFAIQMIIAAAAGIAVFWRRITHFFSRIFTRNKTKV